MQKLQLKHTLSALALSVAGFLGANAQTVDYLYDVVPAPGSSIEGFMEGSTLKFKLHETPVAFLVNLYDDGEFNQSWYSNQNQFELTEDGYYQHEFLIDYIFTEGKTYEFEFKYYSDLNFDDGSLIGSQSIYYTGLTANPVSDVALAEVSPASPGELALNADGSATVGMTFTAPVTIDKVTVPIGMGADMEGTAVAANDAETEWTVTIPADAVTTTVAAYDLLQISVYALDGVGKYIYQDGLPFISLEYTTGSAVPKGTDFIVDIADKTVSAPVEYFKVDSGNEDLPISPNDANIVMDVDGNAITVNPYTSITVTAADGTIMSQAKTIWYQNEEGEEMKEPFDGTVTLETPITAPGTYSIHFPYMAFHIGEETLATFSAEKTVEFTIEGSQEEAYLILPGVEGVEALYAMQVVFGQLDHFAYLTYPEGKNRVYATLIRPEGETAVTGRIAHAEEDDGTGGIWTLADNEGDNSLLFQFYTEDGLMGYRTPGLYTLIIPAGSVLVNGVANSEARLEYLVGGELRTMSEATVLNPESQLVGNLMSVQVTWDKTPLTLNRNEKVTVKIDEVETFDCDVALSTWSDQQDNQPGLGLLAGEETPTDNVLNIYMPFEAFGKTGSYIITLPQGIVSDKEGAVNPLQVITFYSLPYSDKQLSLTPECANYGKTTVDNLETIVITCEGEPLSINNGNNIRVDFGDEQHYVYTDGLVSTNDENTAVIVNVAGIVKEKGEYSLVLPEGAFIIGNENVMAINNEGYYSYIVTNPSSIVESIDAQEGRYVVYGVNGVLVLDTDNAADLRGLANGLYIINGKKVLVRE